ncbi:DUF4230 domain-containing protein [Flavihumibacter stibioxidans]|uniref:DUF4230 domain-containing protein n=1 Tax=Flavihumibacter stibioxidans TaxID=1834163 RepID=A0ABR7M5X8_9BACT|nr:DUF4230 domain-containing protein [Flavihumibacter stibioxidans]MBC6490135.1 hypothetical protein [Flavihumibacter stibioxidans]
MIKNIRQLLVGLVILAGGYFLAVSFNLLPSFSKIFSAAPVIIDDTPILIKEVRQISEMVSITSFDEVVVSSHKPAPAGSARQLIELVSPAPLYSLDRLVLVIKGKIMVGTDLAQLSNRQVYIQGDSVSMQIPPARILDIIVNPSDTETFIEKGDWSPAEVNELKMNAREKLRARAIEKGLLKKADEQSLLVISNFLRMLGYKKIRVVTAP